MRAYEVIVTISLHHPTGQRSPPITSRQHILLECIKHQRSRETFVQNFNVNKYDQRAFLNIIAEPTSKAANFIEEQMILHH